MRRPLSIGTRLVLLYSAVMIATASLPIGYVYVRIERMIREQSREILVDYATEIEDELGEDPARPERALDAVAAVADRLQPDLQPGLAILRPDGALVAGRGVLAAPGRAARLVRIAVAQGETTGTMRVGGDRSFLVHVRATPRGVVAVAILTRRFDRSLGSLRDVTSVSLAGVVLLTAASGLWLARRSLEPLDTITRTAREISADRLDTRIPVAGTHDELDRLAETLNEMIGRIEDGTDRLRQFSIDAAHQLKSPLASLRNRIEVTLETRALPEEARELLADLAEELGRVADGVGSLLELARSSAGLPADLIQAVDLRELLDSVAALYEPMAAERGIALGCAAGPSVTVRGHPGWLRQLFGALVENAVGYAPAGSRVQVDLEARDGEARVRVSDQGPGIAAEEIGGIFERFRRGEAARGTAGLGLGLALAREFARAHGGEITVSSAPGRGSCFTVRLPVDPAPSA
jgi:heavy metal sensor kinase